MSSPFSTPIPAAPRYRAPGGMATDISGGLASFAQNLNARREAAALEAYRQAQLDISRDQVGVSRDKLDQDFQEGVMDRQMKKEIAELQADVDRERNQRIRDDQERDRSSAIETTTRDLRNNFERNLKRRTVSRTMTRFYELSQKKTRTPQEEAELGNLQRQAGLASMDVELPGTRADSLGAMDATEAAATGPLSSEAAARLRQSLGLEGVTIGEEVRTGLEAEMGEAFGAGVTPGRIIAKVRQDIQSGELPAEAEQWAADYIRGELAKRRGAGGRF